MTNFAVWRMLAESLAPSCASSAEGAQATEERQDKRDSLRLCPAVVLSLLANKFPQAAVSASSLYDSPTYCLNSQTSTSCMDAHDR
jgi:hypothetical protein